MHAPLEAFEKILLNLLPRVIVVLLRLQALQPARHFVMIGGDSVEYFIELLFGQAPADVSVERAISLSIEFRDCRSQRDGFRFADGLRCCAIYLRLKVLEQLARPPKPGLDVLPDERLKEVALY